MIRPAIFSALFLTATWVALSANTRTDSRAHYVRTYSATADVTIFSVTVFSRTGVGGGFAALDQSVDGSSTRLRFLSGSTPSRAHGLNRQGFIDEEQAPAADGSKTVRYFGFITNNNEHSLSEAKAALERSTGKTIAYTAAKGMFDGSLMRFRVATLELPSSIGWAEPSQLIVKAAEDFKGQPSGQRLELRVPSGDVPETFLRAVMTAIKSTDAQTRQTYAYNGYIYQLETNKQPDAQTGRELTKLHLADNPSNVIRMRGKIRRSGESEQDFQLWFDRGSDNPLPLRFEYRPRSYLKLVFSAEADRSADPLAEKVDEVPDTALNTVSN